MNFSCVIIEDEIKAKEIIERYIEKVEGLQLVGYCQDGLEALNLIPRLNPDIIFLDINMPNLNGLELLSLVPKKPHVIITTAYSEYALESYDFEIVDYLLKPIAFSKFLRSVSRIKDKVNFISNRSNELTENRKSTKEEFAIFKSGSRRHKVYFREIMYLEKDGNYLEIVTVNGKKILIRSNMKEVFSVVPEQTFIRIHKSFVVNVDKIKVIEVSKITLTDHTKLPLGVSYRKPFNERMTSQ